MTGKTHLAVGVATALVIIRPDTLSNISLCIGAAVIGSVISDIDVKTSDSSNAVNKLLSIIVLFAIIEGYVNYKYGFNILNNILARSNMYQFISGLAILVVICIICKELPHRSFTHSMLGVITFSLIIYYIYHDMMLPFAIAMSSHIVLDMLNKKSVLIWYPFKRGIAFNICKSDGIINNILCLVGLLICGGYLYYYFKII